MFGDETDHFEWELGNISGFLGDRGDQSRVKAQVIGLTYLTFFVHLDHLQVLISLYLRYEGILQDSVLE